MLRETEVSRSTLSTVWSFLGIRESSFCCINHKGSGRRIYGAEMITLLSEAMPLSQLFEVLFDSCIFRKNRALAPHERSAVPLGNDIIPVTICKYQQLAHLDNHRFHDAFLQLSS